MPPNTDFPTDLEIPERDELIREIGQAA